MADDPPLSPLDDAFVSNLVWRVGVDDHLIGDAAQRHWKEVIAQFPVAEFITEMFDRGYWRGDEDWFVDPGIQEIFEGYDWRRHARQDRSSGPQPVVNAPQAQVSNAPAQINQAGLQPSQTIQPQTAPGQYSSQPAQTYPLLPQNTPVHNNQAGLQPAQNIPQTQVSTTPGQNNQVRYQPVQNIPQTQVPTTPGQNSQAEYQPVQNIPQTQVPTTPGQNNQAEYQPAQNIPPPQFSNTPLGQDSQAGRLTAQATYPLPPPTTPLGQNSQTGYQNPQALPTPQTQNIPPGGRTGQHALQGQVPTTTSIQNSQAWNQGAQTLPTPQTLNIPPGGRTGQYIPPRQNPVTPSREGRGQGQAQLGSGGLTPAPDITDDNGPPRVDTTANMQGIPTGQQPQTANSAAANTQGNSGARQPRLPRTIPPNRQGDSTAQQPQAADTAAANTQNNNGGRQPRLPRSIPPNRQGVSTGQQPQAADTTAAITQNNNGGRQPRLPRTIPPNRQGDSTGQQPQDNVQTFLEGEGFQNDGGAPIDLENNTLYHLSRMIPPQGPSIERLPSPPYNDQLDLDSDLQERLAQSDQPAPVPAPANDGSIPPPLQASPEDMERQHIWKGQRLPGIGVRLAHLKNFLCDEDVDRDISWKEHINEAEAYLKQIKKHYHVLGQETRDMVERLLEMVAVHRLFEKYHYGTFNSTKIITPDQINKPAPRLKYNHDLPIVLHGKGRPGSHKAQDIMPHDFPDQPRRQGLVNNMWLTARESRAGLTDGLRGQHQMALARAEDDWWQLERDQTPREDNLSVMENKMYEDIIATDSGRGFDGWVNKEPAADGGPGLTRWCAGPTFLGDCAGSFARERGARRAGLQGALRQFRNMENQLACTPWRRLVLPPTREELKLARRTAGEGDGRKWPLKALDQGKMRKTKGKDDPQGFTVAMAQFWRDQQVYLRQVREAAIGGFGGRGVGASLGALREPRWVTPPETIWGPYVWRAVDPDTQNHQDMLKQMRAAKKLFDRELRIAPRQLLSYMNELYKLGYANQGLNQGSVVFQDPQTKVNVTVSFHQRRDVTNGNLVDLDKMEMYWIRFLLNNSITTLMTEQIEPRTSLYVVFAERLNRIFNDISDPLFPCNGTKVSVEDLLDYMHKKTDGPVKTVKFYAHDAQRWLARLATQGRCRYEDDWRCYGWVQRPVPDCHPENLINWQVTDQDENTNPSEYPEDMVFAPRVKDLRAWGDVINDGQPPDFLCGNVTNYFQCLAYRWGRYMHKLENPDHGLERGWKTSAAEPFANVNAIIDEIERTYREAIGWNQVGDSWDNNPLVSLVKRTLPQKSGDATICPRASIQIIRDHVIDEAVRNDTMLWPARNAYSYTDIYDEKVRPPLWDWAKVEVRGPVKKFFDVNRWPLQLQTEDRQRRIESDQDLCVQQTWNPITEDPTPWTLYRPKARPYLDEKVKYRAGHRIYPIGDTPRQKKVVENQMYATIGRAMGLPDTGQARTGLLSRLSGFFRRGGNTDDDDDHHVRPGSRLPRVNPKDIPKSYDPRAKADKKRKAVDDARDGATKSARLTGDQLPDGAVHLGGLDGGFGPLNDPRGPGGVAVGDNVPLGPRP